MTRPQSFVHALAILAFSEDYARISIGVWLSKSKSDFSKDGDTTHELGFFKNAPTPSISPATNS